MKFSDFNIEKYRHIQACSYDAGGGNVLAHLLFERRIPANFLVNGPSIEIYLSLFSNFRERNSDTLPLETDLLFASTGWASEHEFNFMKLAISRGVPVVAILDHWTNYNQRFIRNDETIIPDYFLVLDDWSEKIVVDSFKEPKIIRDENFYLKNVVEEVKRNKSIPGTEKYDFIFFGEPLSRTVPDHNWNEFVALREFFVYLRKNGLENAKIAIKAHPSEDPLKYDQINLDDFPKVDNVSGIELSQLLAMTKAVVGCHSMALYIAESAGIPVYIVLPPNVHPLIPLHKAISIMNLDLKLS